METRYIEPWGTFEIDPATNLPALPEGQFWRVKKFSERYLDVHLRERTRFGSRKIDESVFDGWNYHSLEYVCAYILYHKPNRRKNVAQGHLIGDYPPKRA